MPQDPYAATAESDPYAATAEQSPPASSPVPVASHAQSNPPITAEHILDRVSENMDAMAKFPGQFSEDARKRFQDALKTKDYQGMALAIPRSEYDAIVGTAKGAASVTTPGLIYRLMKKEDPSKIMADIATFFAMAPEAEGVPARVGEAIESKPANAGNLLKSVKDRIQPFARKVTGIEAAVKQATEKAATKFGEDMAEHKTKQAETIKDNLRTQRDARLKIEQDKLAVAEKNKGIEAANRASQDQVAQRTELAKTVDEQSAALGRSIEQVESKVYEAADQKFKAVRAQIGNVEAPPDSLIASVKNVEKNVLQDIPENVKEFRSILKLEGDEGLPPLFIDNAQINPGEPGYEGLRQAYSEEGLDSGGEPSKPITWDKLQSLKSRLDARLRSRTPMNGDLKRGLFSVRDSVVDEMGKMAEAKGAGDLWTDARDFWRQMREDFHEPTGPSGSGSPVAQALDAVDPKNIRQPFLRTQSGVGNRAIDILRKYPQYGGTEAAAQAEQLLGSHDQMLGLPKKASEAPLKTSPGAYKLPTNKPIPSRPETPTVDVRKVALAQIEKAATSWKTWSQWDARRIAASAMGEVIGQLYGQRLIGAGMGYTAGTLVPKYIGTLLDKPEIAAWLADTPVKEAETLAKIPGVDKIKLTDGITEMVVKRAKSGRPVVISQPAANLLGPKNIARIVAAGGMVAGGEQKKSKSLGQQLKEINAMRSSNPNLPIGESEP